MRFRCHRKRIDLEKLLKVDENENAYVSYQWRSKPHQSESDDRQYRRHVRLKHAHIEFNLHHRVKSYRFRTF